MNQQQMIKDCIKSCQDVINKLQSLTGQTQEKMLQSSLEESRHHLEMCMYECEWAAEQAP